MTVVFQVRVGFLNRVLLLPFVSLGLKDDANTPQLGTADAEIRSHPMRTQSSKVLPLKPVFKGQNTAMHTSRPIRDFFLDFYFDLPSPFTYTPPKKNKKTNNNNKKTTTSAEFFRVSCG